MSNRLLKPMLENNRSNKKLQEVIRLWSRKDLMGAAEIIEEILLEGSPKVRAEALLFYGMVNQDQGLSEDARALWVDGLAQAGEGTFLKYLLQYNIGSSYQREGKFKNSLSWYRAAIQTCVSGDEFSCDQTLTSLLSLFEGEIPAKEKPQVTKAVEKSWNVLELPGSPDLTDLSLSIRMLNEGFSKLLADTIEG